MFHSHKIPLSQCDEMHLSSWNQTQQWHFKYINKLQDDYKEASCLRIVKCRTIHRTKSLWLVYVFKIVSTIVRCLKNVDLFNSTDCINMLNRYNTVKFRFLKFLLELEIKRYRQITKRTGYWNDWNYVKTQYSVHRNFAVGMEPWPK